MDETIDLTKFYISREEIQYILGGSRPKNLENYRRAFVHKSLSKHIKYVLEQGLPVQNYLIEENQPASNERLEFLGDSILDYVVTKYLYTKFPGHDEGFLTRLKIKIVKGTHCVKFSKIIGLGKFILAGNVVKKDINGNYNDKLLEDVFEAFIAAIEMDLGFKFANEFIVKLIEKYVNFDTLLYDDNYKDILMRYAQSKRIELPFYKLIDETGPPHKKLFTIQIYIKIDDKDTPMGSGNGPTKKDAEQSAAKNTSNVWWLLQGEMQLADLQSNTLNSPKSTQMLLSQMTNQIGTLLRATPDDKTAIHLQNELNLLQKNLSQLSTQKSNLAFIQILTLLQQNVMNLPLKVSMMQAPKSNAQPEAIVSHSSTTDHWLVWLEKSVTRVLSLISIRHVTTPITPLATIQDEMVLKDNIRLLLQQAKWMLVDKQAQPFEIIRQQIRQLLLEQFDVNDSGVKELLDQLQNMSMSNQPTLDFSNAMHLVGQGLEQSMQPKVTP